MVTFNVLQTIVELSLLYTLPTMGLWLSNRVVRRYDISLEGSFCIGGAVTAFLSTYHANPILAIFTGILGAVLVGCSTFILHFYAGIEILMAGIVLNTALFSVGLLLTGSHLAVPEANNLFYWLSVLGSWAPLMALVFLTTLSMYVLYWFLKTERGLVWRAVGDNPTLINDIGKSVASYKLLTFIMVNGLSGLSGALMAHYVGFFSIWSSVGTLVIALTGLLGAQLLSRNFGYTLFLGALLYQTITMLTLEINIRPEWHKIIAAFLTILLMSLLRKKQYDTTE